MTTLIKAPEDGVLVFDDDYRRHMADVMAPEASPGEIEMFLTVAAHVQLDPLRNQIWLVPRYDSAAGRKVHKPQVGIDGLRLIAQRSGLYGGSLPPEWCGTDGVWRDVWMSNDPPYAARFRVIRKDWSEPAVAVARWAEYVQTTRAGQVTQMWASKPTTMICKVAEAAALRRAFPAEMAGLYTTDELPEQVELTRPTAEPVAAIDPAVEADFDSFMRLVADLQQVINMDSFKEIVREVSVAEGHGEIAQFTKAEMTPAQSALLLATAKETLAPDTEDEAE